MADKTYSELLRLYKSKKAYCSKCGCALEDNTGLGVGAIFVLDKCGNFYCMDCDHIFEDGDERIFEPDLSSPAEWLKDKVLDDIDMYNPVLEKYIFHYNDKDAIAVYHLTEEQAIKLANEARRADDMWSALLGVGGVIYDEPDEYLASIADDENWVTCESFLANHLVFEDDKEAKEWGKNQSAGKYEYINCKVGDEDVILCQTNLVYEDKVWNAAFETMEFLASLLPKKVEDADACVDEASELRDKALELFQERFNVRILHAFDEY